MNEILIRKASPDDAILLKEIGSKYFYHAYKDVKFDLDLRTYIPTAFVEEEIAASIRDNTAYFMIAFKNESPCGYIKMRWDRTHPNLTTQKNLEIERIYVDREMWRDKVGSQLMDAAIDYAKSNRYETLWLGVWQENQRAISFYQHKGLEIFGTKKFYIASEENSDYVLKMTL